MGPHKDNPLTYHSMIVHKLAAEALKTHFDFSNGFCTG